MDTLHFKEKWRGSGSPILCTIPSLQTIPFTLSRSLSLSHSHSTWKPGQQISLSGTTGHYNCTKFSKKMGSKALLMLKGVSSIAPKNQIFNFNCKSNRSSNSSFSFSKVVINHDKNNKVRRCSTTTTQSSLEPPDVSHLAETARISLTPNEVEEFAPKIRQVIDWFGQLQDVDLHSIEPSIRADTEDSNLRDDIPETFENRESMIAAVPSYEEPYIKVPKVLNKE